MADFILLMHNDAASTPSAEMWQSYLSGLRQQGVLDGGSSIGGGTAFRKELPSGRQSSHLAGYIRVRAESAEQARQYLSGNPVFERGGTVEIRQLPTD